MNNIRVYDYPQENIGNIKVIECNNLKYCIKYIIGSNEDVNNKDQWIGKYHTEAINGKIIECIIINSEASYIERKITLIHELKHRKDLYEIGLGYRQELCRGMLSSIMEYRAKYEEYMYGYREYDINTINKIVSNLVRKYTIDDLINNIVRVDNRFTIGLIGVIHAYNDNNDDDIYNDILLKFKNTEKILRRTVQINNITSMNLYAIAIDINIIMDLDILRLQKK